MTAKNCPTGKSIPIIGKRVKAQNKKYFALSEGQIRATSHTSRPDQRGVWPSSRTRDGDAVDAEVPETRVLKRTAKTCGPDVAVLASTHLEATTSQGAKEAKEPFSGESTK